MAAFVLCSVPLSFFLFSSFCVYAGLLVYAGMSVFLPVVDFQTADFLAADLRWDELHWLGEFLSELLR